MKNNLESIESQCGISPEDTSFKQVESNPNYILCYGLGGSLIKPAIELMDSICYRSYLSLYDIQNVI